MVHQGSLYIFLTATLGMDEGLGCRLALAYTRFSQNSGFLMLNACHAGFPSCDLFNAYDLKSSLASEGIIVENVTCNPLLLHSAGQVIDFQKKKKLTVQILLGKSREKLLLAAVKSCAVGLGLHLGRF